MLGYDIAQNLPELQRQAESRMTETVQIGLFRDGYDPETGDTIRELVEERYSGPARVKYPGAAVRDRTSVQVVAVQDIIVSIPSGSPTCYEGDMVRVGASTADPLLVGKEYTISGAPVAGQVTANRYPVEELS